MDLTIPFLTETRNKKTLGNNRLIFSDFIKNQIRSFPITIIDAGGRGGIEMPWNKIDQSVLKIIGFEPDNEECQRLNNKFPYCKYIPLILWSNSGQLPLNLTQDPSCSSIFKPNIDLIKKYEEANWQSKIIKKIIKWSTTSIDIESSKLGFKADFLKIDTHGAELEILKGAIQALKNDIFGVLVETWTIEVYKNQPTSEQIISFMKNSGFDLFDIGIAASWKRTGRSDIKYGKRQLIGLDLLFLRKDNNYAHSQTVPKIIKNAAIAEIYGYPDYAVELLNQGIYYFPKDKETFVKAINIVVSNFSKKTNLVTKLYRKLLLFLTGVKHYEYPKLHP